MKKLGRNSFRLIMSLVAALVLCFAMSIIALATDGEGSQMQVNDNNVNVRPDAGTTGDPVGKANSGQVVTILGQKNDSDGNLWYQVSFHDDSTGKDVTGYIIGKYLSPYSAPVDETPVDETGEGDGGEGDGGDDLLG